MDQLKSTTIHANDWQGRHNYPEVRMYESRGNTVLIRSNSCVTESDNVVRPHHVEAIKKAFKQIRKDCKNPRGLKKINRDYLRMLSGKLDSASIVQILGDYRNAIKPPRVHVERETKTDANVPA